MFYAEAAGLVASGPLARNCYSVALMKLQPSQFDQEICQDDYKHIKTIKIRMLEVEASRVMVKANILYLQKNSL